MSRESWPPKISTRDDLITLKYKYVNDTLQIGNQPPEERWIKKDSNGNVISVYLVNKKNREM